MERALFGLKVSVWLTVKQGVRLDAEHGTRDARGLPGGGRAEVGRSVSLVHWPEGVEAGSGGGRRLEPRVVSQRK
jgi:hypothetical protein